ncbi:MAG: hypothetical protein B7Z37_26475 [Verrucomicrobia bacterium 12-59-8]|nr:MAG: hypothetical protein B7Z37_26475 [Verrucomicrobia bacterium 12-59-8]
MKLLLLTIAALFSLTTLVPAADPAPHTHEKIKAGPTGGRLITEVEPHVEFFVNQDKKVEIRFINDDHKIVPPASQVITVILGDRSAPTRLAFTQDGDKLISDKPIPTGNDYPTVVQIRAKEGAKPLNQKFNLNLEQCPTCKYKEYACICAHGDEDKKEDKK